MTSISDSVRRYTDRLVDDQIRKATDKVAMRREVETSLDFAIEHMFSAEAIGRAAGKLGGDRHLAVTVIAFAFGAKDSKAADWPACARCDRSEVIPVGAFGTFPARVICAECGVLPGPADPPA